MGDAVRGELRRAGYARYEISNYARAGFEAVHNSLYWRGLEYAAAGCGACGFLRLSGAGPIGRRWMNDRSPERYLDRVEQCGLGEAQREELDREDHLRGRGALAGHAEGFLDDDPAAFFARAEGELAERGSQRNGSWRRAKVETLRQDDLGARRLLLGRFDEQRESALGALQEPAREPLRQERGR